MNDLEKVFPRISPDLYFSWVRHQKKPYKCYITKMYEDIGKAHIVFIEPEKIKGDAHMVFVENLFFTPEQALRFPDGSIVTPKRRKNA